jgi:Protein of unknown function (DUF1097)
VLPEVWPPFALPATEPLADFIVFRNDVGVTEGLQEPA